MGPLLTAFDAAWDYYRRVTPTNLSPTILSATTLYGRDTISVVKTTCGAGCSYLGNTGNELLTNYFDNLYNGYLFSKQFDQVMFYEFGRNFWLYGNQLAYHSPDIDPTATGFAVYMRFAAIDAAGVPGAFVGSFQPYSQIRIGVTNMIDLYLSDLSLNWSNTFRINTAPANFARLGCTDLFASLLMRIARDFSDGDAGFNQKFFRQVALRPGASSTKQALDNFALAASATVNKNLVGMFTNTWRFPISTNAGGEALRRWGPPVILQPRLSFGIAQRTNLFIQWQSAVNTSYQLQSSPDLQTWSDIGPSVVGDAQINVLTNSVSSSSTNIYLRLKLN